MSVSSTTSVRCAPIAWRLLEPDQIEHLLELADAINVELVEESALHGRLPALVVCPDARDQHADQQATKRAANWKQKQCAASANVDEASARPRDQRACSHAAQQWDAERDSAMARIPVLTLGSHGAFQLPADAEAVALSMHQACQRSWTTMVHGPHQLIVVAGWAGGAGTSDLAQAIARGAHAVLVDASGPGGTGLNGTGQARTTQPRTAQAGRVQAGTMQAGTMQWADVDVDDVIPGEILLGMLPRIQRVPTLAGTSRGGAWADDPRVVMACRELRCHRAVVVDAGRWNAAAAALAAQAWAVVLVGPAGKGNQAERFAIRLATSVREVPLPRVNVAVVATGGGGILLLKHALNLVMREGPNASAPLLPDSTSVLERRHLTRSLFLRRATRAVPTIRFTQARKPWTNRWVAKKLLKTLGFVTIAGARGASEIGGWTSVRSQLCAT